VDCVVTFILKAHQHNARLAYSFRQWFNGRIGAAIADHHAFCYSLAEADSATVRSLREIDTSTSTGVASPTSFSLLFLFTGFLERRPDNGGHSLPNFSLRVFSIVQMIFPETPKPKRR
jgi:hypothetical protein